MSAPGRPTAWWARAARPARPPLPRALMVRGALGTAVPLGLGLLLGRLDLATFAALGAMHATMNDRVEPFRLRAPRIALAPAADELDALLGRPGDTGGTAKGGCCRQWRLPHSFSARRRPRRRPSGHHFSGDEA
ncbi:hypothetical protein [Kitasatospora terrestris]|uniref:Uncharacterized protein n=1 Tax=Kitasatospora terrestris TaxID=258051 RepID=A0ABP9DYH3_9ACTN